MFTKLLRVLTVASVTPAALAAHPPATLAWELPVQTVDHATFSGLTQRRFEVITTPEHWGALWAQTHALVLQPPPLPSVDFAEEMVIAVASGEHTSGGHTITITHVRLVEDALEVWVEEALPEQGQLVTQALCQPYHFVRVPRVAVAPRFIVSHITAS